MSYAKAAKHVGRGYQEDEPEEQMSLPGACFAYGCPLPGSHAENGSARWFCVCHDGISGSNWHAVTNRVRNREFAFKSCLRVLTASPISNNWNDRARAFLQRQGLEGMLQENGGSLSFFRPDGTSIGSRKFFSEVFRRLVSDCRKGIEGPDQVADSNAPSKPAILDIGDLIG